ncbi:hypothetical protein C463_06682 [Halorubrum californiense DSM 19288]|uniref:GIY-YIG domain-containing protein n=1 Tax=Halorubrum californiense DSM 19288 TaxID=1227465 RepID=M0EBU8_9EURY|nr:MULTISPECIES: hypothetical protein [Halorubrum]ELZ45286.1 hypothetical protein C463_06682 [Halorubrum californiense DSM 19288]TKX72138.1 hypothetical protein EXE40_05660 [Halorubrum sp. GN11GM_10-3_MGM]
MSRRPDLDRLYDLLDRLEANVGGKQRLKDCTGYMDWPDRGVYLFFAAGETRDSTDQLRLTRIGTHAVSTGSSTSLWDRLRTHRGANRGSYEGGGNHRGSVFRKRVGEAMIERDGLHDEYPYWGQGSSAARERRLAELEHERRVSEYIRDLPFLWIDIDDEPSPESDRAYIERNMIALASNYAKKSIDGRDCEWLGNASASEAIRQSGLWNVNHVGEEYAPAFLDRLETAVEKTTPP